jgi:hypothetical protein
MQKKKVDCSSTFFILLVFSELFFEKFRENTDAFEASGMLPFRVQKGILVSFLNEFFTLKFKNFSMKKDSKTKSRILLKNSLFILPLQKGKAFPFSIFLFLVFNFSKIEGQKFTCFWINTLFN